MDFLNFVFGEFVAFRCFDVLSDDFFEEVAMAVSFFEVDFGNLGVS